MSENTPETQSTTNDVVATAHESRFDIAHYSEALTAFSSGYKDPENLSALLDFLAPSVPVGRRFEFKKASNADAFLSEDDDVRAIGSAFKRVEYRGQSVNEKTLNKGLTIRVDHDEVAGDDWHERYVQLLVQRLYRNEIRRVIAALDSAARTTEQKWGANSNPDADVRKALVQAADKSGVRPNRVLMGEGAWDLRAGAFEAKENSSALRAADMAPSELARKLLVDEVRIMRARFQASKDAKEAIVGNAIYAYFAQNEITKDEPSNIKRFITPVDGALPFRVYLEESSKYTDISVEHYSNIVITSDIGIEKIKVSE